MNLSTIKSKKSIANVKHIKSNKTIDISPCRKKFSMTKEKEM